MKLLLKYLKPYKWMIALSLLLATINQVFSMLDPHFMGIIIDKFATHPHQEGKIGANKEFIAEGERSQHEFIMGIMKYLIIMVGVAMVS
ncbi:MAG: ABC transporter ATP-binding protein, partial [Chitinophagaceae bacterium]